MLTLRQIEDTSVRPLNDVRYAGKSFCGKLQVLVFGFHACRSVLNSNSRKIKKVYIQNEKYVHVLRDVHKSKIEKIEKAELDRLLPRGAIHQGIVIEVDDSSYYKSDISDLKGSPELCCIAILDGITDQHNFGAIIRTAAAFNVFCIIVSSNSSCKINGVVAKSASGGLEHVPIYIVKNLSQTIRTLKEYGFWIVSLCECGEKYLHEIDLRGRNCLVFGSEGSGIRHLQKENSDFLAKLLTSNDFSTLNVSNAAAVAFYEVVRQTTTAG